MEENREYQEETYGEKIMKEIILTKNERKKIKPLFNKMHSLKLSLRYTLEYAGEAETELWSKLSEMFPDQKLHGAAYDNEKGIIHLKKEPK